MRRTATWGSMAAHTHAITVEEFERFVDLPENADRLFEYIGGEIAEVPSNPVVSQIAARISYWIMHYLMQNPIGVVTGKAGGYMVAGERYAPDVAFISNAKGALAPKGYNPNPPDLAVEVVSPTDKPEKIRVKMVHYLAAGVMLWIVNPETKTVEVYTPGPHVKTVGIDGTLDGGGVLPGFTLAVKAIFPDA